MNAGFDFKSIEFCCIKIPVIIDAHIFCAIFLLPQFRATYAYTVRLVFPSLYILFHQDNHNNNNDYYFQSHIFIPTIKVYVCFVAPLPFVRSLYVVLFRLFFLSLDCLHWEMNNMNDTSNKVYNWRQDTSIQHRIIDKYFLLHALICAQHTKTLLLLMYPVDA